MNNINAFLEYIILHKFSLEQDIEKLKAESSDIWDDGEDEQYMYLSGQVNALGHILEAAKDF